MGITGVVIAGCGDYAFEGRGTNMKNVFVSQLVLLMGREIRLFYIFQSISHSSRISSWIATKLTYNLLSNLVGLTS